MPEKKHENSNRDKNSLPKKNSKFPSKIKKTFEISSHEKQNVTWEKIWKSERQNFKMPEKIKVKIGKINICHPRKQTIGKVKNWFLGNSSFSWVPKNAAFQDTIRLTIHFLPSFYIQLCTFQHFPISNRKYSEVSKHGPRPLYRRWLTYIFSKFGGFLNLQGYPRYYTGKLL